VGVNRCWNNLLPKLVQLAYWSNSDHAQRKWSSYWSNKNNYMISKNKNITHFFLPVISLCILLFIFFDNNNLWLTTTSLLSTNSSILIKFIKLSYVFVTAIISYVSIVLLIFSIDKKLYYTGVIFLLFGVVNTIVAQITGTNISVDTIQIAVTNIHFYGDFFLSFWKTIALQLIVFIALIVFINFIKLKNAAIVPTSKGVLLIFISTVLFNFFYVYKVGERRAPFFGFNLPITFTKNCVQSRTIKFCKRSEVDPLTLIHSNSPKIIIFIIDESVTYEALVKNNSLLMRQEALTAKIQVPHHLFKAHSSANHSAVSNYILRTGFTESDYPDTDGKTLRAPSIFSYAKTAGYNVVFYDAQSENNRLQNLMSPYDLVSIDKFLTSSSSTKRYMRDLVALDEIEKIINSTKSDKKLFISMVRYGLHFPYTNSIPPDLVKKISEECQSSDTSFSDEPVKCKKNQYDIALMFSVDTFMERLFKIISQKDYALIYTSDHGQDLNSKHKSPHGSSQDVSECEISVPIFVAGTVFHDMKSTDFISTHFQIPPTIKKILGYENIHNKDAPTLWEDYPSHGKFLRGIFNSNDIWFTPSHECVY
jgi:glucan phosphoethanolaminetransferase (alkaline phosphatase superfamily)